MCGIFGRVGDVGTVESGHAAIFALAHRGPDAQGLWRTGEAELGHTRLSIVDLSEDARQPMTNEDGTVWVVFNGEIYNFLELRPGLEQRGHRFRSRSDTEVIVHLYEEHGADCIDLLDGMFAIAIYDTRARRLVLARDRPGKKPLFYAHVPGRGLTFASEPKALFAAGVPMEVHEPALVPLLAYGYVPAPETLYRNVLQLPPATRLVYDLGSPRPRLDRYWHVSFAASSVEANGAPFNRAEAREELRYLVDRAVTRRLISDVPLGAFLSGGIDSTVIVGLMAQHSSRPVRTFSIGMSGNARFDETSYARLAAQAFGTDHTEFVLEPTSFELIDKLVWHHDGPFGDSSAIPTYMVSKLTRAQVTVALTGDGGDEIFGGYMRFVAGMLSEHVPRAAWWLGERIARGLPQSTDRTLLARAARFLTAAGRPLPDRLLAWNPFFAFDPGILRGGSSATADHAWEEALEFQRGLFSAPPGASVLGRIMTHNFHAYLAYDLLVKTDRTSMANSLEARCPLLDTRLIEYCAALPDRAKVSGLTTKALFRETFADLIPEAILKRGKMGFGVPLGTWLRGPLKEFLRERLLPSDARLSRYLEPARVRHYVDAHFAGAKDYGHQLWLLLTLELWLRQLPRYTQVLAEQHPAPPAVRAATFPPS